MIPLAFLRWNMFRVLNRHRDDSAVFRWLIEKAQHHFDMPLSGVKVMKTHSLGRGDTRQLSE